MPPPPLPIQRSHDDDQIEMKHHGSMQLEANISNVNKNFLILLFFFVLLVIVGPLDFNSFVLDSEKVYKEKVEAEAKVTADGKLVNIY